MRTLIIGDTHMGMRADSPKHNQQILDFFSYVCEKHPDVDNVIHLGDFFDHRSKIQVATLNKGIEGAELLSKTFGKDNVYVLVGNHDIFYRDSLDVSSLTAIDHLVTVVDSPISLGNYYLSPWIITQEQWDDVVNQGEHHDYLFAHLELNEFRMNDHHVMEHGHSPKELREYKTVITGHYHSPQKMYNIQYTGTPIPMSQSEANRDMGYYILEDDILTFHVYDKVKVVSIKYADLEDVLGDLDDPENTSIRVEFPDELADESLIGEVADILMEMNFSDVKVKYAGSTAKRLLDTTVEDVEEVENIDAKVKEFIEDSSEVVGVDRPRLDRLYNMAKEREICD